MKDLHTKKMHRHCSCEQTARPGEDSRGKLTSSNARSNFFLSPLAHSTSTRMKLSASLLAILTQSLTTPCTERKMGTTFFR